MADTEQHPRRNGGESLSVTSADLFKRQTSQRIFVNRSVQMEKIKFYGFDMDYTLAQYVSPLYETMSFKLMLERLVETGYPPDILQFKYDHTVPIRGLWFDKEKGLLLKVDTFGNILSCLFGLSFVTAAELRNHYENKFVLLSNRFYVYDTLFNLPEIYCLASVIEFFKSVSNCTVSRSGFNYNEVFISFRTLFTDVREATNYIHDKGELKKLTVEQVDRYVHKDPDLADLLRQLSAGGAKLFLLTNSGYWYTEHIMTYLLGDSWRDYFDYAVVDACKPRFFADGSLMRVVDPASGKLKLGTHTGPLQKGTVYSGGSCADFSRLIGCRGKDVLYIGDHIFGDIVKSKKVGWRTLLIVPELANELFVWKKEEALFVRLQELDAEMSRAYQGCTIVSKSGPSQALEAQSVDKMKRSIRETVQAMDASYGFMGSLFRSGGRLTSFASQLERYADLYAQSVTNLLYYPNYYMFRGPMALMTHESTVSHKSDDSPPEKITAESKFALRASSASVASRRGSAPNAADIQQVARSHDDQSADSTASVSSELKPPCAVTSAAFEEEDSAADLTAAARPESPAVVDAYD
ncbi:hypothetical protein BOX15_Mlig027590g1 [Macrostomum lignano]|uniref:5'-nucleotidase domain-containing protein 4 n=2 Tax=Macrostomum lignano TaxID=282301 RepID=A0A1I8H1R7_9PLAT|nr:hypothetical protein BOX15_Mlig027590g1 [Macrostomum lignano]